MKKKLFKATLLVLCAVALVVGSVLATIAYLTASSGVSNVFTVGNVSITMYESKVDADGQIITGTGAEKVIANSYHLVPNKTYHKDPTIKITSTLEQDDMYLFVKSVNPIRYAEANNFSDHTADTPLTMREQMHAYGWVEYIRSGDGTEIIWVYGTRQADGTIVPEKVDPTTKQKRLDAQGTPINAMDITAGEFKLCDTFTIHKDANTAQYDGVTVNFTAFAIQTSGLDTVQKAWNGVKESYPFQCGITAPQNPYSNDTTTYGPYDAVPVSVAPGPLAFPLMTPNTTTTIDSGSGNA